MLVYLEYKPRGHNIKHFRTLVNSIDDHFKEAFPHTTKEEEKRFELLKKAYIDSRYKKDYIITAEELKYLGEQNQVIGRLTKEIPPENITRLKGINSKA